MSETDTGLEAIELGLLLDGIYQRYGYDLRAFAPAVIQRRIRSLQKADGLTTVSALQERVLREPTYLERLLTGISSRSVGLFEEPQAYAELREHVVPLLRTYPVARIWLVGCGSGEEAYSLAILLTEADLYHRCRLYATDVDATAVERAKAGRYSAAAVARWTENYRLAGGRKALSDYLQGSKGHVQFTDEIRQHLVFAQHNLATDDSFNEFNLIICRNVLANLAPETRGRAYGLFHRSLAYLGMLAVGKRDAFKENPAADSYELLPGSRGLYRRIR